MENKPIEDALEAVNQAIVLLEAQRDFGDIDTNGFESLAVLNACYELIARTEIIKAKTVMPTEEMLDFDEVPGPYPAYMHSAGAIDDLMFAIATGHGEIDLKAVARQLLHRSKFAVANNAGISVMSVLRDAQKAISQAPDPNSAGFSLRKMLAEVVDGAKLRKITQEQIAEMAGIQRQTLSAYLNGRKSMTTDNYEKVVAAIQKYLPVRWYENANSKPDPSF